MTSITDIPISAIKDFLRRNNYRATNDKLYDVAKDIILNSEADYYPDEIVNWIIAYNFYFSEEPLKTYKTTEIEKLSQKELSILARKLGSDKDDKETVLDVLSYLHKIDDYDLLTEDIKFMELLPKLGLDSFLSLCATDIKHRQLCDNDKLWKQLWEKDYGGEKLVDKSYKDNYILAYKIKKLYQDLYQDLNLHFRPLDNSVEEFLNIEHLYSKNERLTVLPKEIGLLTNLKGLTIHGEISELPKEIGNLTKLQYLNLNGNKLTSLPKEIGKLHSLRIFMISDNLLTELPKEIGNLINLRQFYVTNNNLRHLPKEIVDLPNLRQFYVNNNNLRHLPKEILNLKRLKVFDSGRQRIEDKQTLS